MSVMAYTITKNPTLFGVGLLYVRIDLSFKNKPKLTIAQQIDFLSNKGVKFNIKTKEDAENFLSNNNYLFKIKSYTKNYSKNEKDLYLDLDFAYLIDLSIIDMHLRRFILNLCLNVEHLLKVRLLKNVSESENDGYEIVKIFLNKNDKVKNFLKGRYEKLCKQSNKNKFFYTAQDNILKANGLNLSIWNLVEIIDFGSLISFCELYDTKCDQKIFKNIKPMLFSVKCLRNLSAHNNCIINNLNVCEEFQKNNWLRHNFKNYIYIHSAQKKLKNPIIHDFILTFILFDELCNSKNMKKHTYKEILNLFKNRMKKNKNYYKNNTLLTSSYIFVRKFLIALYKKAIKNK